MIPCLVKKDQNRRSPTEEMFDLLINPHLKVLDLSKEGSFESEVERNLGLVRLASVRCSVIINSS
jgi:hypothetical protein